MKGEVKSYSKTVLGYGFIKAKGIDFFFHIKEWKEDKPPVVGDKVEFEPTETSKGKRALQIRRLDNGK